MNTKLLLLLSIITCTLSASGQELYCIITDTRKEAIVNASIQIITNGKKIAGTITDFDGVFNIKPADTGTYEIQVSYIGYHSQKISKTIARDKQTIANYFLAQRMESLPQNYRRGCGWKKPLINKR